LRWRFATIYRTEYGEDESVAELIPFMLSAFLQSDRGFAKARKELSREHLSRPKRIAVPAARHPNLVQHQARTIRAMTTVGT